MDWTISPRCAVNFLIDGYNLLHAVGWMNAGMKPSALAPARTKLLDWLADSAACRTQAATFRVVFDAMKGPGHTSRETTHRTVTVSFAYRSTADDRIEELLDGAADPKRLVVVSNDTRLHESARRARAKGWFTPAFLDWMLAAAESAKPAAERTTAEKPDGPPPPDEAAAYLRVFDVPITLPRKRATP